MFVQIIVTVVFPIFALIGVGALLNRACRLDLTTLTSLNFYVFVPALVFVKMLDADLAAGPLVTIGLFSAVHALLLLAVAWAVFSRGALARMRTAAGPASGSVATWSGGAPCYERALAPVPGPRRTSAAPSARPHACRS
jgi:predicted permease